MASLATFRERASERAVAKTAKDSEYSIPLKTRRYVTAQSENMTMRMGRQNICINAVMAWRWDLHGVQLQNLRQDAKIIAFRNHPEAVIHEPTEPRRTGI